MLGIFTSGRTIRLVKSNLLLLQTSLGGLRDEPRLPNVRALNILSVSGRCLWDQESLDLKQLGRPVLESSRVERPATRVH